MRYKNKTSPDLMHLGIGEDGFGSQMKDIRLKGREKSLNVSSLQSLINKAKVAKSPRLAPWLFNMQNILYEPGYYTLATWHLTDFL